ncbi:hypothetical protein RB195_010764 [Necator americanus]|uniref:Reverse transcriptase domain-containing protein n=1 Tax=Necator americanus TaxID=51031 RepID=A0ABR1CZE3_NECAM
MLLCLTFVDLKKAFDSLATEEVMGELDNQGVSTQCMKKGIRQGDTISPKTTLKSTMRKLEYSDIEVKVEGRQLHHLRFADDILIKSSINQAEQMLAEFDETCGCVDLQLNLQKAMLMKNGWVSDASLTLNGTNISELISSP